jgi:hypothetical protein
VGRIDRIDRNDLPLVAVGLHLVEDLEVLVRRRHPQITQITQIRSQAVKLSVLSEVELFNLPV